MVQLILIKLWSDSRTMRRRRIMLAGFALCVLLPVLQAVVVTHREQVEQVCQTLVKATQNGDMPEIGRNVSSNFNVGDIDRERFLTGVENALTHTKVENANLRNVQVEIHDDGSATAQFTITCRLATRDTLLPNQVSAWTVRFEHVDGQWLLIEANPRPTPLFPFSSLEDLLR